LTAFPRRHEVPARGQKPSPEISEDDFNL